MSIQAGSASTLTVTLKVGGSAVSLPTAAVLEAALYIDNVAATPVVNPSPAASGADWAAGVVVVEFSAADTASLVPGTAILTISATIGTDDMDWNFPVTVDEEADGKSALFSRSADLPSFRTGRLAGMCGAVDISGLSDDYLWELMLEAESAMARDLGILLEPTEIFPEGEPTPEQLAEIGDRPYLVEPGYDAPPDFFSTAKWGITKLRQKLLISVQNIQIVYPSQPQPVFTVPQSWILLDRKGSIVQIVPGSSDALSAPLSVFTMQALSAGYTVPQMARIRYTAGLTKDHELYNAVRGLTLRLAAVLLLKNSFIPQSGSISADGLSQSLSMDVSKYQEAIDDEIHKLKDRLKGPIWGVL